MNVYSCNCLNIQIRSSLGEKELKFHSKLDLIRDKEDVNHKFFEEGLYLMSPDRVEVSTEQPNLEQSIIFGLWNIKSCVCCLKITHGTHIEKGHFAIVPHMVMDDMRFKKVPTMDNYSPFFKVALPAPLYTNDPLPCDNFITQETLDRVKQQVKKYITTLESQAEEDIRAYAAQKRTLVEKTKQRANVDIRCFLRLTAIANNQEKVSINSKPCLDTLKNAVESQVPLQAKTTPKTPTTDQVFRLPLIKEGEPIMPSPVQSQDKSRSQMYTPDTAIGDTLSHDHEELLFNMDDQDSTGNNFIGNNPPPESEDESDDNDSLENYQQRAIQSNNARNLNFAKSVPVDINFGNYYNYSKSDLNDGGDSPVIDIAASMKAIAMSCMTDTSRVFGELPKTLPPKHHKKEDEDFDDFKLYF